MPYDEADSAHGRSGGLPLIQVVSAACKVLASLAAHAKSAAVSLTASAQNYLAALRQSSSGLSAYCSRRAIAPPISKMLCVSSCGPQYPCRCNANAFCRGRCFTADGCCFCRFLFILGHLLRYGIETIEATDQPPDRAVTAEACLDVFLSFFKAPTQAHGEALSLPCCLPVIV